MLEAAQRFVDQLVLVADAAVERGADDVVEAVAERQVRGDLARVRFVLGGDHGQAMPGRVQGFDRLADAGVDLVLGPAVRSRSGRGSAAPPARPAAASSQQRAEAGAQRRTDPAPQFRRAGGTGRPICTSACSTQRVMPTAESISVPSMSKKIVSRVAMVSAVATSAARLQRGDRRQFLAFEELEERAAAGGDVATRRPRCRTCRPRPACRRRRRSRTPCDAAIARARVSRALAEGVELEHADRAVPHHGAGVPDQLGVARGGVRADVEDHVVGADGIDRLDRRRRVGGERAARPRRRSAPGCRRRAPWRRP